MGVRGLQRTHGINKAGLRYNSWHCAAEWRVWYISILFRGECDLLYLIFFLWEEKKLEAGWKCQGL